MIPYHSSGMCFRIVGVIYNLEKINGIGGFQDTFLNLLFGKASSDYKSFDQLLIILCFYFIILLQAFNKSTTIWYNK